MRKVRFQFTLQPLGCLGISSFYIQDLNIPFLIDGSDESESIIKEMLYKKFHEGFPQVPEEHRFPVSGYQILGWSVFETKADSPLTMDDMLKETAQTYAPLERKSGGQGPQ